MRETRRLAVALVLLGLLLLLTACGSAPAPRETPLLEPLETSRFTAPPGEAAEQEYVLNRHTGVFHEPDCAGVRNMKPENRESFFGTREEALAQGYTPCGNCRP